MPPTAATVAQRPSPGLGSAASHARLGESRGTEQIRRPSQSPLWRRHLAGPEPAPLALEKESPMGVRGRVCSHEIRGSCGRSRWQRQCERRGPQTPGRQRSPAHAGRLLPASLVLPPCPVLPPCGRAAAQSRPPRRSETPSHSSARPSAAGWKLRHLPPLRSPALCPF